MHCVHCDPPPALHEKRPFKTLPSFARERGGYRRPPLPGREQERDGVRGTLRTNSAEHVHTHAHDASNTVGVIAVM